MFALFLVLKSPFNNFTGLSEVNGGFSLEVDNVQKSYELEFYYKDA